jgi:thiol-disulfide isomerase/thioredoxin
VTLVALATGALAVPPSPTVLDLRVTRADGTVAPLRDVVGTRPTLITFWATYCAPCRAEVPTINRAAERWRADGLRVLGVALESDVARARDAHDTWGMRYDSVTIAKDQDALVESLFPHGLPTTAFVARDSLTLDDHFLDDEATARMIPPLLAPPKPRDPQPRPR